MNASRMIVIWHSHIQCLWFDLRQRTALFTLIGEHIHSTLSEVATVYGSTAVIA